METTQPQQQPQQQAYGMEQVVIELTNRIRVLESKNSELAERMLVMNQNMINEYKKLIREIKSLESEIDDMKNDMNNMKNIIKHLTDEAKNFAKKDSLKVLEKYINLWNPLTFVTPQDVRRIIEEEYGKKHGKRTTTH
jgi:predicted  nucleic acid-binding Zn-ribbon protein